MAVLELTKRMKNQSQAYLSRQRVLSTSFVSEGGVSGARSLKDVRVEEKEKEVENAKEEDEKKGKKEEDEKEVENAKEKEKKGEKEEDEKKDKKKKKKKKKDKEEKKEEKDNKEKKEEKKEEKEKEKDKKKEKEEEKKEKKETTPKHSFLSRRNWLLSLLVLLIAAALGLFARRTPENVLTLEMLRNCSGVPISASSTELRVPSHTCNLEGRWVLDLRGLRRLRSLEVGDECFAHVQEVKLVGLRRLERMVVGENSFHGEGEGADASRRLEVRNCRKLKEVKIGRFSFADYAACVLEGLSALEKVEVGDGCFSQASGGVFELVNCPRLRSVRIGDGSFVKVVRAAFESGCGVEG